MSEPCEELQRIWSITREAQEAGLEIMKPGTPAGHIAKAIREKASASGWEIQGGRIGHAMGLDYSEGPLLNESNGIPLQVGNTAVVHATSSLSGTGKMFVPLGDVRHVTDTGPELLMSFQHEPFVAGA